MDIEVIENEHRERMTVDALVAMAPVSLDIGERVPGVSGRAFDVPAFYRAWTKKDEAPSHLVVEAADEFTATVPWGEAARAAFVFEQDGAPLKKGHPLRLYVPDGSSACLNVKSVVRIRFVHDPAGSEKAAYGFKNEVSPADLSKKL